VISQGSKLYCFCTFPNFVVVWGSFVVTRRPIVGKGSHRERWSLVEPFTDDPIQEDKLSS